MRYDDLTIQLGPTTPAGVHVRVSCELGGDDTGTFRLPVDLDRLRSAFAHAAGDGHRNLAPVMAGHEGSSLGLETIGSALFDSVFRDGPLAVLERSLGSLARERRHGIRLRIRTGIQDVVGAEIQSLPWELLHRSAVGSFLGLGRKTPIVRHLDLPREIRARPLPRQLRIVVMASEPRGVPPLNVHGEAQALRDLEDRVEGLRVDILPRADLDTLRSFLLDRETDVVHFIGHGAHDPRTGGTRLYLEALDGSAEAVETRAIVDTLDGLDDLRLIVLNACETGRLGSAQPFASLAPALLRAGLPAVLAMQRPILDEAAVRFSDSFYRRLCSGDPVDSAVTEARMALSRHQPTANAWPIPALFLRTPDGELFTGASRTQDEDERKHGAVRPNWRAHLEVHHWEAALTELRRVRAIDPNAPAVTAALAVALAKGNSLRRLPYATAMEMHRLLVEGLSRPDDRGLSARCLLALKLEYFQPNAVREPKPTFDQVFEMSVRQPIHDDDREILSCLKATDRTLSVWSRLHPQTKGTSS